MKKRSFDFEKMPIKVSKKRTGALVSQMNIEKSSEAYEQWEQFCTSFSDDENELFDRLCINSLKCVPIVEQAKNEVRFECMYAVCGKFTEQNSKADFKVGRLEVSAQESEDFDQSGIIYITIRSVMKTHTTKNPIIDKLAYLKAKKDTKYKIRIELLKKLCQCLKSKGIQYVPLSSVETQTYEQVWFEIFLGTKISKKGIAAFFQNENSDIIHNEDAVKAFDEVLKKGATVLLCKSKIGVRISNALRLKSKDMSDFADVIVTSHDFSWTYYSAGDGKKYFYCPKKENKED